MSEVKLTVRQLLPDESRWIKGKPFEVRSDGTEYFCLTGAVARVYSKEAIGSSQQIKVLNKIIGYLNAKHNYSVYGGIAFWNDHFAKWEDVDKLIDDLQI